MSLLHIISRLVVSPFILAIALFVRSLVRRASSASKLLVAILVLESIAIIYSNLAYSINCLQRLVIAMKLALGFRFQFLF